MADTVTLKEMLAVVVRRGRTLIALCLVFAVLLGAFCAFQRIRAINDSDNTPEAIEQAYQDDLASYLTQKEVLTQQQLKLKQNLESYQTHMDTSLLMQLDAYKEASTVIDIAITELAPNDFEQVYEIEGTPADYIITRIQNQYLIHWRSINLATVLGIDVTDQHWREVVSLENKGGGILEIKAIAQTEEESAALAQKVYQYLMDNVETVSQSAYRHGFSLLSNSSKTESDSDLATLQKNNLNLLSQYEKDLAAAELALEALAEPQRAEQITVTTIIRDMVKYAVLGGVLGVILGVIWIVIGYFFGTKLVFADDLVQDLKIPMMMSFSGNSTLFTRLSDRILGERVWYDETQALAFLSESASVRLESGVKIALLSSLALKEKTSHVQSAITALETMGHTVCLVENATYSAKALSAISGSDCVIFMERRGVTGTKSVELLLSMAAEQDKPVKGFILI